MTSVVAGDGDGDKGGGSSAAMVIVVICGEGRASVMVAQ